MPCWLVCQQVTFPLCKQKEKETVLTGSVIPVLQCKMTITAWINHKTYLISSGNDKKNQQHWLKCNLVTGFFCLFLSRPHSIQHHVSKRPLLALDKYSTVTKRRLPAAPLKKCTGCAFFFFFFWSTSSASSWNVPKIQSLMIWVK